ncbi:MAG: glycoside hydrolase family 28 protein, partial [Prevotella sp.]|nr:glycoside hydrolase family 28 protein [Candidatus Prevotella equi]
MMKKLYMTLLAVVCALQMMADYNVKDFGAKGDGTTLDSPAINAAIEEAV